MENGAIQHVISDFRKVANVAFEQSDVSLSGCFEKGVVEGLTWVVAGAVVVENERGTGRGVQHGAKKMCMCVCGTTLFVRSNSRPDRRTKH